MQKTANHRVVSNRCLASEFMEITINTNTVYSRTWLEKTEIGFLGMHHTREVTRDGRVIRDETGPTGLVATWTKPETLCERILG